MSYPSSGLRSPALRSCAAKLQAALAAAGIDDHGMTMTGDGSRWEMTSGDRRGTALLSGFWFIIDFPPGRGRPQRPIRLLEQNAQLPGNAKHVLAGGSARTRAEIPLDATGFQTVEELEALVRRSIVGVAVALGAEPDGAGPTAVPDPAAETVKAAPQAILTGLCADSGWSFSERSENSISVDLEVADSAHYRASVEPSPGGIHLSVNPNRGEPPAEETSRKAVAALMLSVAGSVRMVSAFSRPSNGKGERGHDTFFRVELPPTASSSTFAHSLSALSVACELCGREVRALAEDSDLARAFLEISHPRSLPSATPARRVKRAAARVGVERVRHSQPSAASVTEEGGILHGHAQ